MQRSRNHSAFEYVVDSDRRPHLGQWIQPGVVTHRDRYLRELFTGRAVRLHM